MIDIGVELMDGVGVGMDGVNGAGGGRGTVVEGLGLAAGSVAASAQAPDPEVRPIQRRFIRKVEDKLRLVREFDACRTTGEKGALLRREGIYSSYICRWRQDLDKKALSVPNQKRGPKPDPARKEKLQIAALQKQNLRLEKELKKAHIIIDIQKKLSEVLGIPLRPPTAEELS